MAELIALLVAFGLLIAAGRRLGAGSDVSLAGLFPAQAQEGWPRGVQEADVPRFVFRRAD